MDDARLFAGIRAAAETFDPPPADLVDRMIAAVAVADLSHEYALLTFIDDAVAAVRSDAATSTLQFGDGDSSLLLHISHAERGLRRIDGWITADAVEIQLIQDDRRRQVPPGEAGRFAFDDVRPGLYRVLVVTAGDGKDLLTPQFEA